MTAYAAEGVRTMLPAVPEDRQRIVRARVPDHDELVNVTLDGHLVTELTSSRDTEPLTDRDIDADGRWLLPGFLDLYSRLREPGFTRKGTIASESHAALRAGFTQVLCAPDTDPVIDNVATLELIQHRAAEARGATVLPMAALTAGLAGEQLAELATLADAGCPAASQADRPIRSMSVLHSAMEYAASFDLPLIMCARDANLAADGCAHAGATATRLGLPAVPVAAETVALAALLELCRDTGARLHLSRVSSARAVEMIAEAKHAGLPVSADVGIHHLFFTDSQIDGFDAHYRSAVPFRSLTDRAALREGIRSGVIDAICSDHAPHDVDARLATFPACEPGLSAYDRFLTLLLALPTLVNLPFEQLIRSVSSAPRHLLARPGEKVFDRGEAAITAGCPANLILLDHEDDHDAGCDRSAMSTLTSQWFSQGRNSPLYPQQPSRDPVAAALVQRPRRVVRAWVDGESRL